MAKGRLTSFLQPLLVTPLGWTVLVKMAKPTDLYKPSMAPSQVVLPLHAAIGTCKRHG